MRKGRAEELQAELKLVLETIDRISVNGVTNIYDLYEHVDIDKDLALECISLLYRTTYIKFSEIHLMYVTEKGKKQIEEFKSQDLKKELVETLIDDAVLVLPEGCDVVYENKRYDIEQYSDMMVNTENVLSYVSAKIKIDKANDILDGLEKAGSVIDCVLDKEVFGEFEEGTHDASKDKPQLTLETMEVKGNNYYFQNYNDVKEFLRVFKFEYEIPQLDDVEHDRYCIEIRNDKIIYCAIERINSGLVYDEVPFYDNVRTYRFKKVKK